MLFQKAWLESNQWQHSPLCCKSLPMTRSSVSRFPLHRVQHEPKSLIGVLIANLPNDWNVWVVFGMLILSPGLLGLCSA